MSLKIGDKVRFLNEVGGGTVIRMREKGQVIIEDEDGFEIPMLIRECIAIEEEERKVFRRKPTQKQDSPVNTQVLTQVEVKPKEELELEVKETRKGELLSVSLAFLPVDPTNFMDGRFETYLVNESNYYLAYNYMNRQNNSWISRQQGEIEPNMQIFLEEFAKDDINKLEHVCLQFIAYKKGKPFASKNVYSVESRLDPVKFYKRHCFVSNDYFDDDAIVRELVRDDVPSKIMQVSLEQLEEKMNSKIRADRRKPKTIEKQSQKQDKDAIIEMDLHADSLLDTTVGMSNSDILNYQLEKFNETLAKYAKDKGRRVVFIHGKGNGVLRKAVERELRVKYKTYTFQDASFREYGFGATMVTIK